MSCPEGSRLGTATLNVPGLPSGSLQGYVFLGGPASGAITGPPYVLYVEAESERYGVIVRLKGLTSTNESTGQLTTTFTENPEQPFTNLVLHFNGGPLAPLANGLRCETSAAKSTFTPFGGGSAFSPTAAFAVSGCARDAAVRKDLTEHSRRCGQRRWSRVLHVRPHAHLRAAVRAEDPHDAAGWARRRDPGCHALR